MSAATTPRTPCTGGPPPWCCQPPITQAEWDRMTERLQAAREAQPKTCPSCGAADPIPTFDGDEYECVRCGQIVRAAQ